MGDRYTKIKQHISEIIKSHRLWLNSSSKNGQRANFSGTSLKGVDFAGNDLSGANFKNSTLRDVNFQGANLSNAIFRLSILRG